MKNCITIFILFIVIFAKSAFSQVPTEGLVAYYPFNGNAFDESGNGNIGNVFGATFTQDRCGNPNSALYFDGIDDYVNCGNDQSLQISGDITVAIWAKYSNIQNADIIEKYSDVNSMDAGWGIGMADCCGIEGQVAFGGRDHSNTYWRTESTNDMNDNIWHFYVGQRLGNKWRLYVDGILNDEIIASSAGDISSPLKDLIIGRAGSVIFDYYNGSIDDIRIFNYALNEQEINELYNKCFPHDLIVLADNSVWLRQNSEILSGSIYVDSISSGPYLDSQVELSIGEGVITAVYYDLKANQIKVKQGAVVNSDVYYNNLTNHGTITGTEYPGLDFPLILQWPEFKTGTSGITNITVAQNDSIELAPGDYGDIIVKRKGKIFFTGGIYNLRNLNTSDNVKLYFGEESEIRIESKLDTDEKTFIGPTYNSGIDGSDIVFYVAGINGNTGTLGATPKAAQIGLNNTVLANFYVPNGTIWIRENTVATGAFLGKDVIVGISAVVSLDSHWGGSDVFAKISNTSKDLITVDNYNLEQNYPNPFNPSTTITYSIPQNLRVTLKVFDVIGNEVATLVNEEKPAGNFEVRFEGKNLASGIYFYKIQAGDFVQAKKMILLK